MNSTMHDFGIENLSVEQRIELVQDIWDSVAKDAGLLSVTPAELELLHQRLAEDNAVPNDVVPWSSVRAEALKR